MAMAATSVVPDDWLAKFGLFGPSEKGSFLAENNLQAPNRSRIDLISSHGAAFVQLAFDQSLSLHV
ncbi:MAG: hypothetical protein ACOH2M_31840 [Cypionkella sp.]